MTFKKLAETRSYLINPSCRQVESWSIRVGGKKKSARRLEKVSEAHRRAQDVRSGIPSVTFVVYPVLGCVPSTVSYG